MLGNTFVGTFGTFGNAFGGFGSASLFNKTLSAGRFHQFISSLTRRSYRLLDLHSYPTEKKYGNYAGQREVNLDDIRGTEGRLNDFDDHFNPLHQRTRDRWLSVARANEMGMSLPPVELIQVGDTYFVRDGHHRISVARAFGQSTITANVTVW